MQRFAIYKINFHEKRLDVMSKIKGPELEREIDLTVAFIYIYLNIHIYIYIQLFLLLCFSCFQVNFIIVNVFLV